ncbi:uncharacterized protein LOC119070989 isoform X2 [Bradysia coprophila]|uniref:uncharacterized protein LOC119070989 isoform X2 n=1 Tax=Bradysia coprophila TaxID=38358 RepID=UPI00187DA7A9|nr:uncharacterized protein LOC119070989 isoform X2 [Bradysia coprophila]
MKLRCTFVMIGFLLIGISADDNFGCRKIDFNKINSINMFDQCSSASDFAITSYEDNPTVPNYLDALYYLSNTQVGWSCISTIDHFTLEADTEFSTSIFLQSLIIDDMSHVEIEVIDLDDQSSVFPVINAVASPRYVWTPYNIKLGRNVANAKISIRALVTAQAKLAIQYLHILNPRIDEALCEIDDETTTEETTTEETTTEETTTEETTTEETTTEDTTTEETTTEDTTTEDTTTEETTTEETTTEETTTEETTTEETTTEETTTEEATTEEATTDETTASPTTTTPTPPETNENRVWIITSFVFLLTTVALMSGFIYLIYLYKTALAAKTAMLTAAAFQSTATSLPRLTVATSSQGNQIIVGIEHIKQG